jgi:hypothetical protein
MFMCANCKSFLVTETERKHVRRRARIQQHQTQAVINLSPTPPQGKAPKEIHAILTETLGENAPSYATFKNWMAQFKRCVSFLVRLNIYQHPLVFSTGARDFPLLRNIQIRSPAKLLS